MFRDMCHRSPAPCTGRLPRAGATLAREPVCGVHAQTPAKGRIGEITRHIPFIHFGKPGHAFGRV